MIVKLFVLLVFILLATNAQDDLESAYKIFEENLKKLKSSEHGIRTAIGRVESSEKKNVCKVPEHFGKARISKFLKKNEGDDTIIQYFAVMKENHSFKEIENRLLK